jgi:hypothetical protein
MVKLDGLSDLPRLSGPGNYDEWYRKLSIYAMGKGVFTAFQGAETDAKTKTQAAGLILLTLEDHLQTDLLEQEISADPVALLAAIKAKHHKVKSYQDKARLRLELQHLRIGQEEGVEEYMARGRELNSRAAAWAV